MNPTVGSRLAETNEIGDQTLSWILKCLRQHSPSDSVELIASTLAALNNLSYYHTGEDISSTAFGGLQIHLCEGTFLKRLIVSLDSINHTINNCFFSSM